MRNRISKFYSREKILSKKIFYWMRSDTQIYEYVSYFSHILKPMITGKGGGKRYLFHETNIKKFVHMYQNKQLKNKKNKKKSNLSCFICFFFFTWFKIKPYKSSFFKSPSSFPLGNKNRAK